MKRVVIFACLLIGCLLVVPSAGASGDYYCSANVLVGGEGTAAEPWACVTVDQFNARAAEVCRTGGGTLYFLFEGGYVSYVVNSDCSVVAGTPNAGTPATGPSVPTVPPSAGGDAPWSWLVVVAVVAAVGLIAAGVMVRRPHPPRT